MPFFLLQENGDKILLEDLTGFVILEAVAGPTVFYQAGGAGYPVRKRKRRHETQALFDRMERTLREAVGLDSPVVAEPEGRAAAPIETAPWTPERLEAGLADLAALAAGSARLEARFARLQRLLDERRHDLALRDDDEEFWMLMS
jgi:hypothetical protein